MDSRRLILVIIFTLSSFLLWENWQKYKQPKPPVEAATAAAQAGGDAPRPSVDLQQAGNVGSLAPVANALNPAAVVGETFTITTDLLQATIAAQGGDIVRLELFKYKEKDNQDKN
ncbi:MAG: membrane protein insertase YidC, partial [Azonexus sp.]|nr:membrane protein insertase YidC [Azonexus sp.]